MSFVIYRVWDGVSYFVKANGRLSESVSEAHPFASEAEALTYIDSMTRQGWEVACL